MVADGKSKPAISFAGTFTSSAFSACFAEVCTIPLDTAKVRLQLQKQALGANAGIVPGIHRQCLYGGLRIGLYDPVKTLYVGKDHVRDVRLRKKILVALTTRIDSMQTTLIMSSFYLYYHPIDIVKVRLQAEGKLPPGVPRRYSGSLNAYSTIVKQEGIAALWTSLGPNIARNAIINAAELASNDQTILKLPGFSDNVVTHLLSGLGGCGNFSVKSRMMGDSSYKSTLDCFLKTLKNDGPFAFYKVFIPNFGRLGSWNVIMFLTLEQTKKIVGRLEST
ncbi:hypothetical protein AAHE18_12G144300 [Arachis hypogaea]